MTFRCFKMFNLRSNNVIFWANPMAQGELCDPMMTVVWVLAIAWSWLAFSIRVQDSYIYVNPQKCMLLLKLEFLSGFLS